jgi:hypothetical protein
MLLRITLLTFLILLAGVGPTLGDEKYGFDATANFVPRDQYELEYLGLIEIKKSADQQGMFQLIWKGKSAVGITGYFVGNPQVFDPVSYFSYHFEKDWALVPSTRFCGFGISELKVQPGKLTKLVVDMGELESDYQKPLPVNKAKTASLIIGCHEGMLVSTEFHLPPVQ